MAQLKVYRSRGLNPNVPYLLDVQSDLVSGLSTRLVIPLYTRDYFGGERVDDLMPLIDVEGRSCVLMTPEMAGLPVKVLGAPVADLATRRQEVLSAIDRLVTGF